MSNPKVFRVLIVLGWVVISLGGLTGMIVLLAAMGDEGAGGRVAFGFAALAQAPISGTLLIAIGRMGQLLTDATESLRMMNHRMGDLVDASVARRQ